MISQEPEAKHVCTHCGAQHASRSALFRHLKAQCDPTLNKENVAKLPALTGDAPDRPVAKMTFLFPRISGKAVTYRFNAENFGEYVTT